MHEEPRIALDKLVAHGLECWITAPNVLMAVQLLYNLDKLLEAVAFDAPGTQIYSNVGIVNDQLTAGGGQGDGQPVAMQQL